MVSTVVVATILVLLTDIIGGVFGIRFTISRSECLSHKAEYGATVRFSFVVINVENHEDWPVDWHYTVYGTDLVVFISLSLLYSLLGIKLNICH